MPCFFFFLCATFAFSVLGDLMPSANVFPLCAHIEEGDLGQPGDGDALSKRPATNRNSANVKDKTVTRQFWFAIYADLLSWLWIAAQTEAPRCILNAPSALMWQIWVHLSLELAVWFLPRRYMVYFSPLPRLFGKGKVVRLAVWIQHGAGERSR